MMENTNLIQLTHFADPREPIYLAGNRSIQWVRYIDNYRRQMLKHGRKAEVRKHGGKGREKYYIALFVDKVA